MIAESPSAPADPKVVEMQVYNSLPHLVFHLAHSGDAGADAREPVGDRTGADRRAGTIARAEAAGQRCVGLRILRHGTA